jgi:prepilin-type N-terminal cleavage/methylation domain-containing protein/prepilin-type processing-associated H-X9-DG protein
MHPQRQCLAAGVSAVKADRAGRAFSLIELLLTLTIILILFVLVYGSGSRSAQTRSKAACQKNLQTIYLALQIYANDFNGLFPIRKEAPSSEEVLTLLVPKYTSVTEPFICPGSSDERLPEAEPFDRRKISYAYYMGQRATNAAPLVTDRQINTNAKAPAEAVFSRDGNPPGNNHHKYGGNVMFCDGHIDNVQPATPYPLPVGAGIVLLNPRP